MRKIFPASGPNPLNFDAVFIQQLLAPHAGEHRRIQRIQALAEPVSVHAIHRDTNHSTGL